MPTYDNQCTQCKRQFEVRHAINAPNPVCPLCGGATEKVILFPPGIQGHMARGRDLAMRSLQPKPSQQKHIHGAGCGCRPHS